MKNISVTVPLSQALSRVGTVLFQPFDLGKWFVIGFCAWLAYLFESGGGFHGGGGGNFGDRHRHGLHGARAGAEQAKDFVLNNIGWLAPLVIGVMLVFFVLWLVILWLSSRGKFMFLHCVARNVGEVKAPWYGYAAEGNSLFLFRLVLSVIGFLIFVPMIGGVLLLILQMIFNEAATVGGVLGSIGLVLAMIVAGVVFWVIGRLLRDFVVPIQYLRRSRCLDAWREMRGVFSGRLGSVVLYFLFRILLALGIGLAAFLLVILTCCIAGCLMAIPYIGTVVMLPFLVLERSYSLYYLSQFGPDYDVFSPPSAPAPDAGI